MTRVLLALFIALPEAFAEPSDETRATFARLFFLRDQFGGPRTGERPPPFALPAADGGGTVRIGGARDRVQVVFFGSLSCPVFRMNAAAIERVYQKNRTAADFLLVYTHEAHPSGSPSPYRPGEPEWLTGLNHREGVLVAQTSTGAARALQAREAARGLGLTLPLAIDPPPSNPAWNTFGRTPAGVWAIGPDGTVWLRQPWVHPGALAKFLHAPSPTVSLKPARERRRRHPAR